MPIANCPHCSKKLSLPDEPGDYDCPKCSKEFVWDGSDAFAYSNERSWVKFPFRILDSLDLSMADFSGNDDSDTWWASVSKISFLVIFSTFVMVPFALVGGVLGFVIGMASSTAGAGVGGVFSLAGLLVWLYCFVVFGIAGLSAHWRRANAVEMSGLISLIFCVVPILNFVGFPLVIYKFGWED